LCSRNIDNTNSANDDYSDVSIDADTTAKLAAGLVIPDKVAVIRELPAPTPVTAPSADIIATEVSELVHFTQSSNGRLEVTIIRWAVNPLAIAASISLRYSSTKLPVGTLAGFEIFPADAGFSLYPAVAPTKLEQGFNSLYIYHLKVVPQLAPPSSTMEYAIFFLP
jgi:hypothetical protein